MAVLAVPVIILSVLAPEIAGAVSTYLSFCHFDFFVHLYYPSFRSAQGREVVASIFTGLLDVASSGRVDYAVLFLAFLLFRIIAEQRCIIEVYGAAVYCKRY